MDTTTGVLAYEVITLDTKTGLHRRDMLKYLGRTAEREVARLAKQGITARAVPFVGHEHRMILPVAGM